MKKRIILYKKGFRYELALEEGKTATVSNQETAQLTLASQENPLHFQWSQGEIFYQYGEDKGVLENSKILGDVVCYLATGEVHTYELLDKEEILVADEEGADVRVHYPVRFLLVKKEQTWTCQLLSGKFYHNHKLVSEATFPLAFGDELAIGDVTFKLYPEEFGVEGAVEVSPYLVPRLHSRYDFYKDYPEYHRSPRIIYRSSEDKILINPPGAEPQKPSDELLKLIMPPLIMVGVTLLITIFQPRGLYIIATVSMSVVSVIFSVQGFFKNRKKYKEDKKERVELYHLYLKDKAKDLEQLSRKQREGMFYHFPAIEDLTKMVKRYDSRIYEKTPLHFDFLAYRLGLGKVPTSYELKYGQEERSGKKDALEEEGYTLFQAHQKIDNLPIVASLNRGPVGYVGPRPIVLEQLQLLVAQLAVFHSYHDLTIIPIIPEEEKESWDWMRWLPHATLQDMNVRSFVYNQRTRDQVLNSLNQILKLRKAQKEEEKANDTKIFHPHYVVLITDETLILDHVIMEFFREDPTELGCSIIYVADVLSSLSENIQTVISIKDRNQGQLLLQEGVLRELDFQLDHFPEGYDKEAISRGLAPLKHIQQLKSSIPDSVTFLEMYQAETFNDLKVLSRWESHAPYQSLAVPIGLRGKDDLVYLNLHEKAHGPHGLIAGTTGSGKSETIQSYILSLAVNFHPHDVAFLLIDYKGGGMANLFKDLPHLLGTITNLDGAQSMRALASINAEIHRRERLFGQYGVNHINQYQKKFKLGEATEPLPHLFLISDEFAELKVNQPDFIKELVSIARVGRSLGVHLILATQKPSGVVDDQIWSNSRFKLALKVADRGDSMEMLRTADAAEITQTGRAYLQVGNNEVYELFQTAWSGADYQPEKDQLGIEDHTIYLINELGQYEVLNQDLSGLDMAEEIKEVPTELDVIVQEINHLHQQEGIAAVAQPWLPPLKERITLDELDKVVPIEAWQKRTAPSVLIGVADIPQAQKQEAVAIDLSKDGNILLYGSPGTGKTTFLQTAAMDLARKQSPENLTMYLLDFGTNGLAPLSQLPHVADSLLLDQTEKIQKFIRIINRELDRRKKLLSEHGVGTIALYREVTGKQEPTMVILMDSYESMKDEPYETDLFKLFMRISREGLSIGVHLIITASRQNNLRAQLYSNFKHQLTLPQNDISEVRGIVGATPLASTMEDIKGRALMKRDEVDVVQFALPVAGDNDIQIINNLRDQVQSLKEMWTGHTPAGIPMVPDELTEAAFYGREDVAALLDEGKVPLGLDLENVQPLSWDLIKGNLLYIFEQEWQKLNIINTMLLSFEKLHFDSILLTTSKSQKQSRISNEIDSPLGRKNAIEEMYDLVSENIDLDEVLPKPMVIIWDGIGDLIQENEVLSDKILYIMTNGPKVKVYSFITTLPMLSNSLNVVSKFIKQLKYAVAEMRLNDQKIISVSNVKYSEPTLKKSVAYMVDGNHYQTMKLVKGVE
ncbi:type VII secretion protein EssC [Streptococcus sp. HMSC057G03]|uniref:type VII secretion protein EssC n=1 Tax=Streptococcus sp. HMSC057G03 TaxID=1715165 RepID=UPI0008A3C85E|nr:type VII secretion protein EssC [Streptococcus sp. HMSC057G03]MDU3000884.1 type VII secretion protein EssC [Streptococcus parasanguinis]MDU4887617.1 type VII secretion protein EssC [Streptococcus parasanguinis]OFN90362.1 type VII secretion protein EssC [Streptococcus sp. HMSC057G03]